MTDDVYVGAIDTVALLVKIGNGATPEVFAHPCLINTQRSATLTANATANEVANCTDPTKPNKTVRTIMSFDSKIAGDGTCDVPTAKFYADMLLAGKSVNIQVQVGSTAGALIMQGPYVLTSFAITGSKKGDLVTCSLAFDMADLITTSAVAAGA